MALQISLHDLVEGGRVSPARVDDAVRRILTAKARIGLLDDEPAPEVSLSVVGSAEHRSLAREAAAASTVIVVDDVGALPVPPELGRQP